MRVIAGRFRSRRLHAPPPGQELRPTSDKLRETLFNVLAPRTPDSVWLDLFSGTGAVGIEAISRGARFVYFAETSKSAIKVIRRNLEELGIEEGYELIQGEAMQALRMLDAAPEQFDVVFLDPPYNMHGAYQQVLGFLADAQIVKPESLIVAEHDKRFDPGDSFGALQRFRELKQGDAVLSFYRRG